MAINFYSENIRISIGKKASLKQWLVSVIKNENYAAGILNYIFCDDDYILPLNKKFLSHNTLTDIITFDYSGEKEGNIVEGDIFISIPRVRENAEKFKTEFGQELKRVMVHGVLHLCGYKDKTRKDKKIMRAKEDFYLNFHCCPTKNQV